MTVSTIILLLIVGFAAGMLGSMVGIGGGIVVVPALLAMAVLIPGMNPKMATGTSLAMLLPPIGILGVWQYYKAGQVNLTVAGILCLGFVFGGFFGAKVAVNMDKDTVKKFFAIFLLLISIKFLFFDKSEKSKEQEKINTPTSK
jgi:uncharacterized membrane protein YfcA